MLQNTKTWWHYCPPDKQKKIKQYNDWEFKSQCLLPQQEGFLSLVYKILRDMPLCSTKAEAAVSSCVC